MAKSAMLHARMLRYLDEVTRSGSIRKAAQRMNVAASSVNRQIIALEGELGTQLFQRLHSGMRLTAAGEILIAHVRETLKGEARMLTHIDDLKGLRRGKVTIGTTTSLAPSIFPAVLAKLQKRFPLISFEIRLLRVHEFLVALRGGDVDLILAFNVPSDSTFSVAASVEMPDGATVAPNHALAQKTSVALAECAVYPLIVGGPTFSFRGVLDQARVRLGIEIEATYETDSVDLIKRLAMRGLGVAFLPIAVIEEERRRRELVFVPLRDRFNRPEVLKLVHRRERLDTLSSLVVEELKSVVAALDAPRGRGKRQLV